MTTPDTTNNAAAPRAGKPRKDTLTRRAWRQLRRNKLAMICLGIISLYVLSWLWAEGVYWPHRIARHIDESWSKQVPAFVANWAATKSRERPSYMKGDDNRRNWRSTLFNEKPADWKGSEWSYRWSHPLGTDFAGRDNLKRLMQGGRIAFELAVFVAILSIGLGFTLGALAGYFGGWVDDVIVYVYSVFASVPDMLLIIAIAYVSKQALPADTSGLMPMYLVPLVLGMGLTGWVGLCRLIRGEFIKLRERPYVLAAKSLGANPYRVMFKHIAPNVMHLIVITFTLRFPGLVMAETVLTYLGIGIQTEPSWGAMINDARQRLWVGNWWELGGVTVVMFFFVLALNLFGDALRDALDPKLRSAEAKSA